MAVNDFLGKGMKFPPQINKATGRFATVDGEESVRQSLYIILMTQISERPLRPDFGSELMGYTFMDINPNSINWMTRTIREQIALQEPRVTDIDIDVLRLLDKEQYEKIKSNISFNSIEDLFDFLESISS